MAPAEVLTAVIRAQKRRNYSFKAYLLNGLLDIRPKWRTPSIRSQKGNKIIKEEEEEEEEERTQKTKLN